MNDTADVVVYKVVAHETGIELPVQPVPGTQTWGRGTRAEAEAFCRHPQWPAKRSDTFVAVDDWGHGTIVCATPDMETHVGTSWREFKQIAR